MRPTTITAAAALAAIVAIALRRRRRRGEDEDDWTSCGGAQLVRQRVERLVAQLPCSLLERQALTAGRALSQPLWLDIDSQQGPRLGKCGRSCVQLLALGRDRDLGRPDACRQRGPRAALLRGLGGGRLRGRPEGGRWGAGAATAAVALAGRYPFRTYSG